MSRTRRVRPLGAVAATCGLALAFASPPATADVTSFNGLAAPAARIAAGPDGAVWFTEPEAGRIGRLSASGELSEFPAFDAPGSMAEPFGITAGPDGALWYTDPASDRIGRIETTGETTAFTGLSEGAAPREIVAGPDGSLWFTEPGLDQIGRITTDGEVTEFGGLTAGSSPGDISVGRDGALWFAETGAPQLGRIGTDGAVTELKSLSGPTLGVASHGQAVWAGLDSSVIRYDPPNLDQHAAMLTLADADGAGIASVSNGQVWYEGRTPAGGAGIAFVNSGGNSTLVCSSAQGNVRDLAFGPDGAIWFTQSERRIGRLTVDTLPGADCGTAPPPPPPPSEPATFTYEGPSPDRQPEPPAEVAQEQAEPPTPELNRTLVIAPVSGSATVQLPGSSQPVPVESVREIPVGSIVDTARGRVKLTSAANAEGGTQTADFYGAPFRVGYGSEPAARSSARRRPVTELVLRERLDCRTARRRAGGRRGERGDARSSARRRTRGRGLWGSGKGRFRTSGRFSSATVRGTIWFTQDRCNGTYTRVRRGKVAVRDFGRDRTVVVRAGRSYLAADRRARR